MSEDSAELYSLADAAEIIALSWAAGLEPLPNVNVWQWADQNRYISSRSTSEPGPYRSKRTPYLRDIMYCLSPESPVQRVVFAKGSQIGASEAGNNWVGYTMHREPAGIMMVQPTIDVAKRFSRLRIEPMILESEVLAGLVSSRGAKDSSNTILMKEFPGGALIMTGANSPVGLRMMPFQKGFFDEIDAWPTDLSGEGDPILLAERGMRNYPNRKELEISTPTIKGRSRIWTEYLATDQRRFFVPCPHCGHFQELYWSRDGRFGVRYEKKRAGSKDIYVVWYDCEKGCKIEEHEKTGMLEAGEWRATVPENADPTVAGFQLSALYSPLGWFSWTDAVKQWERSKGNAERLRVFVNQTLGEPYEERGEAPPWRTLYNRRETYRIGTIPKGGLFLTAGADVHQDRIEAEIVAWGRNLESWSVNYVAFPGDPADEKTWRPLEALLSASFPHELGGSCRIQLLAVDSGYETQTVYRWVRRAPTGRVIAVKGRAGMPTLVGSPRAVDVNESGRKLTGGLKLWTVGTDVAKRELYGWLRRPQPTHPERDGYGPGYCHFPEYSEAFFRQLTAEEIVRRIVRGYPRYVWELKAGRRNEALDCRCYARAAAAVLQVDRFGPEVWHKLEVAARRSTDAPKPKRRTRGEDFEDGGRFDRWHSRRANATRSRRR